MARNGYYIYEDFYSKELGRFPGVAKKIDNQTRVLSSLCNVVQVQLESKNNKILKRFPFGSHIYKWDEVARKIYNPKFIYIRKPMLDYGFLTFTQTVRNKYPDVKILLEFPTYPYDKEQFFNSIINIPFYIKEVLCRKRLIGKIDRIVTYTDDDEIFGIPTIKIQNGIDITSIPLANPKSNGG